MNQAGTSVATLDYAPRFSRGDLTMKEDENGTTVFFPKRGKAVAIGVGLLGIVSVVVPFVAFNFAPEDTSNRDLMPFVPLCVLFALGLIVTGFVMLLRCALHDVVHVSSRGIKIEQWSHVLERDVVVLWQDIVEYRFQSEGRRRVLAIIAEKQRWMIVLNQPIVSEKAVIECFDQWREASKTA